MGGPMMDGAGMGFAIFAMMGAATLLLLALLVLTVLGVVWLARHLGSKNDRRSHGDPGPTELPPHRA
jgi:predicted lipid-binding transport protein (Tim44 family)